MQKIVIFLLIIVSVNSCIDLRTEYPEIQYYRFTQFEGKTENQGLGNIDATLQIRNFNANEQIDNSFILAIWNETKVQKYNYHRWISSVSEMVTDFIMTRYNSFRVFESGIIQPGSMIIPDFILEGQLLDMLAYSDEDNDDKNFVSISIRISLLHKKALSSEKLVVLNKVFTVKYPRPNSSVQNIPEAYSRALSQISDQMFLEIQEAILDNY